MEQQDDGSWQPWVFDLPTLPGRPGDSLSQHQARALDALVRMIERNTTRLAARQAPSPDALHTDVLIISTLKAVKLQAKVLTKASLERREAATARFAHSLKQLQSAIQAARPGLADQPGRRLKILADLAVATAIGMAVDNLIWPTRQSVAAANEIEYRAWLLRHGAQSATANSAIVRAMYDTVFAYPGGDVAAPGNVEAGSAVLTQMGLISYRGVRAHVYSSRNALPANSVEQGWCGGSDEETAGQRGCVALPTIGHLRQLLALFGPARPHRQSPLAAEKLTSSGRKSSGPLAAPTEKRDQPRDRCRSYYPRQAASAPHPQ
jgi:hypothetical protein